MDILCLGTWTWTIICTLIWLWDLCLILSLFIGIVNLSTSRCRESISLIITVSWFDLLLLIHRCFLFLLLTVSSSFLCFRARPVVHVSSTLQVTPNNIDIIKQQCDKHTWYAIKQSQPWHSNRKLIWSDMYLPLCSYFTAQACFSYTAHPESFNPKLGKFLFNLNDSNFNLVKERQLETSVCCCHCSSCCPLAVLDYTFEADIGKKKARLPPRGDFLGGPRGRLELLGQKRKTCTDIKLRLLVLFSCPARPLIGLHTQSQGVTSSLLAWFQRPAPPSPHLGYHDSWEFHSTDQWASNTCIGSLSFKICCFRGTHVSVATQGIWESLKEGS